MKEQGGAEWGIGLGTKNYQEYVPFLWSNGGDIMNEAGEFTLDSPEAIEALTYYDSFFEEGLAPSERAGRLRHHAGLRDRHAPDVLLGPVAPRPHHRGGRR